MPPRRAPRPVPSALVLAGLLGLAGLVGLAGAPAARAQAPADRAGSERPAPASPEASEDEPPGAADLQPESALEPGPESASIPDEEIPGRALMTEAEVQAYRERMAGLETREARRTFRARHRQRMLQRALERGVELPGKTAGPREEPEPADPGGPGPRPELRE